MRALHTRSNGRSERRGVSSAAVGNSVRRMYRIILLCFCACCIRSSPWSMRFVDPASLPPSSTQRRRPSTRPQRRQGRRRRRRVLPLQVVPSSSLRAPPRLVSLFATTSRRRRGSNADGRSLEKNRCSSSSTPHAGHSGTTASEPQHKHTNRQQHTHAHETRNRHEPGCTPRTTTSRLNARLSCRRWRTDSRRAWSHSGCSWLPASSQLVSPRSRADRRSALATALATALLSLSSSSPLPLPLMSHNGDSSASKVVFHMEDEELVFPVQKPAPRSVATKPQQAIASTAVAPAPAAATTTAPATGAAKSAQAHHEPTRREKCLEVGESEGGRREDREESSLRRSAHAAAGSLCPRLHRCCRAPISVQAKRARFCCSCCTRPSWPFSWVSGTHTAGTAGQAAGVCAVSAVHCRVSI